MIKKTVGLAILYSSLAVLATGVVAFSTYATLSLISKNKGLDVSVEWKNFPPGYKEFSENNSLKIEFQVSDSISNGGGSSFYVSQGTAWPWTYSINQDHTIDWYLITNYHVVNEAIAYKRGFFKRPINSNQKPEVDNEMLEMYNEINYETPYYSNRDNNSFFRLLQSSDKEHSKKEGYYQEILSSSKNSWLIQSLDIIADFNNPDIKLFSGNENNEKTNYNLDIALIKFKFNYAPSDNSKVDNIKNYNEIITANKLNEFELNENKTTYIAGNPGNDVHGNPPHLTPIALKDPNWVEEYSSLGNSNIGGILSKLKAPYYYTLYGYKNPFPLGEGASGSPCYQVDLDQNDKDQNITRLMCSIPVGIYWGGSSSGSNFHPSIIPFITNIYNIFENFINFEKTNK